MAQNELLEAARQHLAARDALERTPVQSLAIDDPRFKAVTDTLAALRAAVTNEEVR